MSKLHIFFNKIALNLRFFQNCLVAVLPCYRGFYNSGPLSHNIHDWSKTLRQYYVNKVSMPATGLPNQGLRKEVQCNALAF